MTKQLVSEEDFKETLKHLILGFTRFCDVKLLKHKDIDIASKSLQKAFETDSDVKPVVRLLLFEDRKKYKKELSKILSKFMSISAHFFLCEYCLYVLKKRLKKLNSLTLPVIKGCLMKKHPDEMDEIKRTAPDVHNLFAHEKVLLKGMIEREETKFNQLKTLREKKKGKEKDKLKSLFFKKRGSLKSSLVKKGRKNAECMLRSYELFTLKMPSKTGKSLRSQEEVANALVEEGLSDKCSQQSISRWNDIVKKELQGLRE